MRNKFLKTLTVLGMAVMMTFSQISPVMAASIKDAVTHDEDVQTTETDAAFGGYEKLAAPDIIVEAVSDNSIHIEPETSANPTPQEVYNEIIAMKAQYPEGMPYTNDDPAGGYIFKGSNGVTLRGYGCAAFAFIMSDVAFGNLPAATNYSFDWDSIRVGDILRVYNNSHSVIVLEKATDYVIVAEANYNSSVHWGRKMTKSEVADGFTYYQTRYPGSASGTDNNYTPGNTSQDDNDVFTATDVRTGNQETLAINNGYYKVLIFGGIGSCYNTLITMQNLSEAVQSSGLSHTELWAFDIKSNSDSTIISGCNSINLGSSINVINGTTQLDAWEDIYTICLGVAQRNGLISGGVFTMPLVAYVNDEGDIMDVTTSIQSESTIISKLEDNGYFSHEGKALQQMRGIESFVGRLYTIALNREAEERGLKDWSSKLASGSMTGSQVACGIFFSDEFTNRNLSDEDLVETLYQVMMGRNSDAAGKADWVYKLKNGVSREGVFAGFTGSTEFDNICKSYGIKRGDYKPSQARDQNTGLTTFVARLYTKALGRDYEVAGINYWCEKINSRKWSINDVSTTGFFNSPEFMNKNTSNDQYVTILYHTFFDREPDQAGYNDWMGRLSRGVSRNEVLQGFANSPEFANLKKSYGL